MSFLFFLYEDAFARILQAKISQALSCVQAAAQKYSR